MKVKGDIYKVFNKDEVNYLIQHPIKCYKNYNLIQRMFVILKFMIEYKSLLFAYKSETHKDATYCFVRKDKDHLYRHLTYDADFVRDFSYIKTNSFFKDIELNIKQDYIFAFETKRFIPYK